ncbi:UPF0533 protein C5orf44 [Pelomyxa schiedti]|nr:UPF0533 protein C5orf44 [Pelomyxa schiedti]
MCSPCGTGISLYSILTLLMLPFLIVLVSLEIRLQNNTNLFVQPQVIADNRANPLPKLDAGESSVFVAEGKLEDAGQYVLVCFVSYTRYDQEKQLTKVFKMPVERAISIKSKISELPQGVFIEACVLNESTTAILLKSVTMEPTEWYTQQSLNSQSPSAPVIVSTNSPHPSATTPAFPFFSSLMWMLPGQSTNFVFSLTPKDPFSFNIQQSRDLGRVQASWSGPFGEAGIQQTTLLKRKFGDTPETLELTILSPPPRVCLESPFIITCLLSNKSTKDTTVHVTPGNSTGGILVTGLSGLSKTGTGVLKSCGNHSFVLECIALKAGIQQLQDIHVTDTATSKCTVFGGLMEVMVEKDSP